MSLLQEDSPVHRLLSQIQIYVPHFCLEQSIAIEIDKGTIVINYADPLGSGADREVCHAMWYKKDVAVKLFKGRLTIR